MSVTIRIQDDHDPRHELNISTASFATLWSALGLEMADAEGNWCGRIDGRILLERCRTTPPELVVRAERCDPADRVTILHGGISYAQATRYLGLVRLLAAVAAKREAPLVWY